MSEFFVYEYDYRFVGSRRQISVDGGLDAAIVAAEKRRTKPHTTLYIYSLSNDLLAVSGGGVWQYTSAAKYFQ